MNRGYKFEKGFYNDNWQHGMYGTPEYTSWRKMKERCLNPNAHNYIHYGSRGITIYSPWLKFENFYADMGSKPDPKYTLERIDNNGNYEPNNVIWALPKMQRRNRSNVKLTIAIANQIRQEYLTGIWTQKKLASKFNISQSTIQKIVSNVYWR